MRGKRTSVFHDIQGAALVEFAMIAPVLILMLLGMFEVGYNLYVQSQLQGAVQQAARTSTIENAVSHSASIDLAVTNAVHDLMPTATVDFSRDSYASFSDVGQPEDFKDINENGTCDDGEQFEDANGNSQWDEDRGKEGFGGARDVVLYSVAVQYPRVFGMSKLIGLPDTVEYTATTVLRNQPYDEQTIGASTGNCA